MSIAIMVLIVMTAVGLVFGFILAYANKKFAVEVNPLIHIVEDALPKGQCGACGYAGCAAYAEAVVLNPEVPPNLCVPGKKPVASIVGELTGKTALDVEPRYAYVKCSGSLDKADRSYNYNGIEDCIAASLLQGGPKSCKYGCIGFGTCVKNCPFGALTMGKNGLPVVDKRKCTGCAKCEAVCPKKVIEMKPAGAVVSVSCNSKDKGAVARKFCTVSCLGCGICARNCKHGAIKIENNLACIDSHICIEKCNTPTCLDKCPTKAIGSILSGTAAIVESQKEIAANKENLD
jgi:Na+-translocating ferredoxin:NAD+ oxidoreductase RNF subunit RnfB